MSIATITAGQKRARPSTDAEEDEGGPSLVSDAVEDALAIARDIGLEKPPRKKQQRENPQQRRSLFIRSLPASITTEKLVAKFSQAYPIKHATAVIDPETNLCKGYGFITFADTEDAQRALAEFNNTEFEGKKIRVELAEPRNRETGAGATATSDGSGKSAGRNFSKPQRGDADQLTAGPPKLIIRNLPWSIKTTEQLSDLFRSYGKIKTATLPSKKPGLLQGFGFVVLRGRKNAEKALNGINGKIVDGRTLAVDWAVDKDTWQTQAEQNAKVDEAEKMQPDGELSGDGADITDEDEDDEIGESNGPADLAEEEDGVDEDEDEDEDLDDENVRGGEGEEEEIEEDYSPTLFIRNLSFNTTDEELKEHFSQFGRLRYARVVMDPETEHSKGTAFVCFVKAEEAKACLRNAPRISTANSNAKGKSKSKTKEADSNTHSILENLSLDPTGAYTLDSRVLQLSQAVSRSSASRLAEESLSQRTKRDNDKRRLFLLAEGTIPAHSALHSLLSKSEVAMRDASAKQRRALIQSNPSLHLSLTRLSLRNVPRSVSSKELKALAREAVVGFAKDVKEGKRVRLSKEELARGETEEAEAEAERKKRGKGIVKQAKIVFESREGGKIAEKSAGGRSRGYGFVEYYSHRNALMGLRWLNGHPVGKASGKPGAGGEDGKEERQKRLIVEFAIENAQVVHRRRDREGKARAANSSSSGAGAKGPGGPRGEEDLFTTFDDASDANEGEHGVSPGEHGSKLGGVGGARAARGAPRQGGRKGNPAAKDGPGPGKTERKMARAAAGTGSGSGGARGDAAREKLANRQRIIMKKRAARRDRKKGA